MVKIITTSYRTQKCRHECQTLKTERWGGGRCFKVQKMEQREKCSAGLPTGVQDLKPWWKENPSPKIILWPSHIMHISPHECTCLNTHIHTHKLFKSRRKNFQKEHNFWKNAFRFLNLYLMNNCHFFLVHEQTLCSFYIF